MTSIIVILTQCHTYFGYILFSIYNINKYVQKTNYTRRKCEYKL